MRAQGRSAVAFIACVLAVGCAPPPQECTYGALVQRTIPLERGEHLAGATGAALLLTRTLSDARFVKAHGRLSGSFVLEGNRFFSPAGLVVLNGGSPMLLDENGGIAQRYREGLRCVPMPLSPELTLCLGAGKLYRLRGGTLDLLYENDGDFGELQFDGHTFCVAIFTFDRMDYRTFLPKKTLTKCGQVTSDLITFEHDWAPDTQVLLSGGKTLLASSSDAGVVLRAADDPNPLRQLEAGTVLQANLCRIWATTGGSLGWIDPRSLDLNLVGSVAATETRALSTNFVGAQASGSRDLRTWEVE